MFELDYLEILEKVLAREAIVNSYKKAQFLIKKVSKELEITNEDFHTNIEINLKKTINWSQNLKVFGTSSNKETGKLYIPLNYYLTPLKHQNKQEDRSKDYLDKVIEKQHGHIVILGKPGMGKTSSMRFICQKIILEGEYLMDYTPFPLVIELRYLTKDFTRNFVTNYPNFILFYKIYNELGLFYKKKFESIEDFKILKNFVISILEEMKIVIILDGFDEVHYSLREDLIYEIGELTLSLNKSKIILTSRTGEFNYSLLNTSMFEIAPLNEKQINKFSKNWLKRNQATNFLTEIKKLPFYDTITRPLTIALLANIYEKYDELPDRPKSIYKLVVDLLLDKWDTDRMIKRGSKYNNFGADRKFEFLSNLSFLLTIKSQNNLTFSTDDIKRVYLEICNSYDLPTQEVNSVFEELESQSGLLVQAGYDNFEFAHKSIQEYLTAEYIVRYFPFEKISKEVISLPHEMAVVVSLSSTPNQRFFHFIDLVQNQFEGLNIINIFLNRLTLELPDFSPDLNIVTRILKLYNEDDLKDAIINLFTLTSIQKCCKELEQYYEFSYSKVSKLVSKNKEKDKLRRMEVYLTYNKKYYESRLLNRIIVPFIVIENWTKVKSIIQSTLGE